MYNRFHRLFRTIISSKFQTSTNCFKQNLSNSKQPTKSFYQQSYSIPTTILTTLFFTSRLTSIYCSAPTPSEIDSEIINLLANALDAMKTESFDVAKKNLNSALKKSEQYQLFTHVPLIFDYLASIAIRDGTILELEELLIRFIENLILIGYSENDDNILRYKLKLSKLYQMVGNTEMAELGFRDCINVLEEKMHKNKNVDNTLTNLIYISSLFWYGRFLTEEEDLDKAKIYMKKAREFSRNHIECLTPNQMMVILFHSAEVEFKLKEYDNSIAFLVEAITLCIETNAVNDEIPIFIVKLGIVYLYKGIYDKAKFWCENAGKIADNYNNSRAKAESVLCLEALNKMEKQN